MLYLAAAAKVETEESVEIINGVRQMYALPTGAGERISDVLTATVISSKAKLTDLYQALQVAGPAANAAGTGIESAAALVASLAEHGILGQDAGNIIGSALNSLHSPDALRALGLKTRDAQGRPLPISALLNSINGAFSSVI